ncbi:flagellar M-ring protein FliF, partial [Octadecabacter sp.]|nr:flagellar M-ring protein FliF [Octadecabacter sp.]
EVSVDTVMESESIIERRFDPETRVAISTDVQESTTASQDTGGGDVTIASNLPDGDGAGNGGTATNENSESRAVTNYEVSETQREILRAPGAIRRVTVAVMVNDTTTINDAGEVVTTPRPAEELEDLRDLVASAVGFDSERGDGITIRSMAFDALPVQGTDASEPVVASPPLNLMKLIQTGVLALVALILGLFVVRPILMSSKPAPALLDDSGRAVGPALVRNDDTIIESTAANGGVSDIGAPLQSGTPLPTEESSVERLRGLIDGRRDEAIQVLQSWIDEPSAEGTK